MGAMQRAVWSNYITRDSWNGCGNQMQKSGLLDFSVYVQRQKGFNPNLNTYTLIPIAQIC